MSILCFIKDTQGELKHVSWPNRTQTIQYTILVIVISVVVSLLLFFYDQVFQFILELFLRS